MIYRGSVTSQTQLRDENVYIDPQDYQSPKKLVFWETYKQKYILSKIFLCNQPKQQVPKNKVT